MTKREEQLRQQIGRSLADIVGLTLPPEGIDALTALLHAAILEGGDATFLDRYQGAVERHPDILFCHCYRLQGHYIPVKRVFQDYFLRI